MYFNQVKFVPYKFGTSDTYTLHQNISQYADLVDQVRDNNSFYSKYEILDGDRPDVLSQKLYGSTKYYWTFFLMNEGLREQGWPLGTQEAIKLAQKERSNTVLVTQDDLTGIFKVGSTVTGITSGETGVIIKRVLDLGQIIIEGNKSFNDTETIQTIEDATNFVVLTSVVAEYDSVWRYENDGVPADVNPYTDPGSELVPVTQTDRYITENEELKSIIVIKPDAIAAVFEQFQDQMAQ